MAHCSQCGSPTPEGAVACPTCGVAVPGAVKGPRAPPSRTMVGVSASDILPQFPPGTAASAKTIVGLPARSLGPMGQAPPATDSSPQQPGPGRSPGHEAAPAAGSPKFPAGRTIVGMAPLKINEGAAK